MPRVPHLPQRPVADLRSGSRESEAAGKKAVVSVGQAAETLRLEVVSTGLTGDRALVGHAVGMRLLIPAGGAHGPRETAALLYLFGDALAVRPTDDAPLSAVPLYGLHIVLPHVAMARWLYKAGRTAHANADLVRDAGQVEGFIEHWTADDFAAADDKVQVVRWAELVGPVCCYQHLGYTRVAAPLAGGAELRLKSDLPVPASAYVQLWELFAKVLPSDRLVMSPPAAEHDTSPASPASSTSPESPAS